MIYFRADGNSEIGMGHVMRCLSIAEACTRQGMEVTFITATKEIVSKIKEKGFQVILLESDYKNMESELDNLKNIIKIDSVILIDSYQMTDKYIEELKKTAKVVCMDDLGNTYPCNMLINYNIYAKELKYDFNDKEEPVLLLGADYVPVREEFTKDVSFELREEAKNVMLTTGGSDTEGATIGLLEAFLRNGMLGRKGLVYHVVIGPLNKYADEIKTRFGKNPQVVLHENVSSMKELMQECDVIVTAAGSTVYEACAIGIPMILFYFVDNQRGIADYFDKNTDVINSGDYRENEKIVCFNAADALVRCAIGRETRRELYEEEKKLVDGKGACRIAEEISKLL